LNILLTCAGRRNYLVDYFQQALSGKGTVFATNNSAHSTAMIVAEKGFIVPSIYDPNYVDVLIKICHENKIESIIPLFDLELPILASEKEKFNKEGISVIVSSSTIVEICLDKLKSNNFLDNIGIDTPRTFLNLNETVDALGTGKTQFPLIIKPRWGMGSIGLYEAKDENELHFFYKKSFENINETYLEKISNNDFNKSIIIQEKIQGQEYGLDIINDLNGNYISTLSKKKLLMRSGETDGAMTIINTQLEKIGETIGKNLRHVAILDVDIIFNGIKYCVLEMNPRFGGGYPFSHLAGANLPAAIIEWLEGKESDKAHFQIIPNIISYKGILPLSVRNNLTDYT
jgi:carbamoyl-phosphate synthase large subunit